MKFQTERTQEEVDSLEIKMNGKNKYPGMTYEEGAIAMLEFLTGRAEAEEIYEED